MDIIRRMLCAFSVRFVSNASTSRSLAARAKRRIASDKSTGDQKRGGAGSARGPGDGDAESSLPALRIIRGGALKKQTSSPGNRQYEINYNGSAVCNELAIRSKHALRGPWLSEVFVLP